MPMADECSCSSDLHASMHSVWLEHPLPKHPRSAPQSGSATHFRIMEPQELQTQSPQPGLTSVEDPSASTPARQSAASASAAGGKPPSSVAGWPIPESSIQVTPQFCDGSSFTSVADQIHP